jgi:acetaldehyde dehydrogenase (acetylating)
MVDTTRIVSEAQTMTTGPLVRRGSQSRIPLKAAIIGGGRACFDLLSLLCDERLGRLDMEILGVADPDAQSPGMVRAGDMGLFTTADFTELYTLPELNMLIELTGSAAVRERMIRSKPIEISSIDPVSFPQSEEG